MSGGAFLLWFVIIYVRLVIPYYGIFNEGGTPGLGAFIPIYQHDRAPGGRRTTGVVDQPVLVPIVNIVILIIVLNDLSKSFGHGTALRWVIFLSWIFLMILAFGSST